MTHKQVYLDRLAHAMLSAGQDGWSTYDMSDLADLAGLWPQWLNTKTRKEEEALALQAATILSIKIR